MNQLSFENEHSLSSDHSWFLETEWDLISKRDNGPGYLNYNRIEGSESLNYQSGTWKVFGTVGLEYYNYLQRTRTSRIIEFSAGIEQQFHDWLYTEFELNHVDSTSNYSEDIYQSNSYLVGINAYF